MSSERLEESPVRSPEIVYIVRPTVRKRRRFSRFLGPMLGHPLANVSLFILTALSIAFVGGWRMSVALMAILLAHEMGHYLACRRHGVSATLPYFIPAPIVFSGTLGALILIRSRFPSRKALFDIGIAGPLAGFLVCLPILVLGVFEATVEATPAPVEPVAGVALYLGDPLILKLAWAFLRSDAPPGATITLESLGMAAWFGLFLTGLNLIPVGQLDGGHILYSVFRARAHRIARLAWWICVALIYLSPSWILWVILLRVLGRRHPPTLDDDSPLGRGRTTLAVVAAIVFILCFIPEPIVGSWQTLITELRNLLPGR